MKNKKYGLNCFYYTSRFNTIEELIDNVMLTGMDPSYEITLDGEGIGEDASDYLSL